MKYLIINFLLILLSTSCKQPHLATKGYFSLNKIELHEGEWYSNFKNEVFIRCLKKIYSEPFSSYIDSLDASSSANIEWLNFNQELFKIVDSIALDFSKRKIARLSIENKKITMNICLDFRNSIELDSASVLFYEKYNNLTGSDMQH